MDAECKPIQVPIGSAIEYWDIEGDETTARLILAPYGEVDSPVEKRLQREKAARDIAHTFRTTRSTLAPLPEMNRQNGRQHRPLGRRVMMAMANL